MENPAWYASLKKSPLTPPNAVFGPVWGVLYVMMAVSLILYWRAGPTNAGLAVFFAQAALNASWSIVFFRMQNPCAAAGIILLMDILVAATIVLFWRASHWAALLLVPYWLWILFATHLNVYVCTNNEKV
jgi:benzodiazapine receptor